MKYALQIGVLLTATATHVVASDSSCEYLVEQERWQDAYAECERSANDGHVKAQLFLADMYIEGRASSYDHEAAIHWYKRAAKQKSVEAHFALAEIYNEGEGVEKDGQAALFWSISAAELGSPLAQLNLGFTYKYGVNTPQDYIKAHMWFNLAAAQGDEVARTQREEISDKMTLQSVKDAQRLAGECVKKNYQDCGSNGVSNSN